MRVMPQDIGVFHFIGIGGIGMSGLAEILHDTGYAVQGSDQSDGANISRLKAKGIKIFIGHKAHNITDNDVAVVVASSAIKCDNLEIIAARENKIPVLRRAELLAELMHLKRSIAVSGTHGKTTTTSMVGTMLEEGGFDPTVINGGIVNRYGTNVRLGQSDLMVVEADESDGTFTRLPATIGIVTNIDPEHMEHYGSFDAVRKAYQRFLENLPFYGYGVVCIDHPEVKRLAEDYKDRKLITYGLSEGADICVHNIRYVPDGSLFDIKINSSVSEDAPSSIQDILLAMHGEHNVLNALSAIAIGLEMGMKPDLIKKALSEFEGVGRRFTHCGEVGDVLIIDDYGHHPIEVEAVLKTAKIVADQRGGHVIAVKQPHRYSRLHDLFDDFCTCFGSADHVIISDVYPAGEVVIKGAEKQDLVDGIKKTGHQSVRSINHLDDLPHVIAQITQPNDIVICLGAGNITQWAHKLPVQLDEIYNNSDKKSA